MRAAAPVEEPINFVHDLAQGAQVRQPARNALKGFTLSRAQMALHEQMAMREEVRDFVLESFPLPNQLARLPRGSTPAEFGLAGGQRFAHTRYSAQDGLAQVGENMKLTDLVGLLQSRRTMDEMTFLR